jgi:hypothetical protein
LPWGFCSVVLLWGCASGVILGCFEFNELVVEGSSETVSLNADCLNYV